MGTNEAGGSGTPGDSGQGDPGQSGRSGGGDQYPSYPASSYPGQGYPGDSFSGYREGVHGEPVPETAWQNPDPTAYQPYPAGYQQPYGQPGAYPGQYPGYPPYPVARPTNGMAVASLVLGILWIYWIGSILSLIFGYIARQQIRERGEGGDGMAVAGIVLGWIGVGVLVLFIAIFTVAGINDGFR